MQSDTNFCHEGFFLCRTVLRTTTARSLPPHSHHHRMTIRRSRHVHCIRGRAENGRVQNHKLLSQSYLHFILQDKFEKWSGCQKK